MSPRLGLALGAALALLPALPGAGQELGARVAATDGPVSFLMSLRPGVQVCEDGIREGDDRLHGRWRADRPRGGRCAEGRARVRVAVRDGRVRGVGVAPSDGGAGRDLGPVAAPDAAAWLLSLAGREDDRAAGEALLAAALADSAVVWPRLLEIARDGALGAELRQAALFWVARAAAEVVTTGLAEVAGDAADDEAVRTTAVFALSRRPPDQAVPALMDVARTAPGRAVRESALFWLARSDDARVAPFFEGILRGTESPRR